MGLFGLDWKKSNAHLLLLSRFRYPGDAELGERWQAVLGESPSKAVKRFQDEGMLIPSGTPARLDHHFRANDLKSMLKSRGLPAAGRKQELIERLIRGDPKGMEDIAAKLPPSLVWSPRGKEIAEEYLARETAKRKRVEQETIEFLKQGKFMEASASVSKYEAKQVFPRGMGFDWNTHDDRRTAATLSMIFRRTPKILSKNPDESQLAPLRLTAGMAELWGTQTTEWLPADFKTTFPMDNDTAARMFLFLGTHMDTLANYRRSGVIKKVEVLPAKDERVCEACASLSGKQFSLDSAPELPYEHCTSESGCRCCFIPVIDRT